MFVTLKVFKLIGPSNDGRRHGRGTYLFCTVCSDCMVLLLSLPESTTWSLLNRLCPLLSSRLLWLCRCPPCGRVELLSLCCDVVSGFSRGIDDAKRQSMTSVGEVTAEEGRGRKCFFSVLSRESCRQTLAYETSMVPQDHWQRTFSHTCRRPLDDLLAI
jgi:hypothetical protein